MRNSHYLFYGRGACLAKSEMRMVPRFVTTYWSTQTEFSRCEQTFVKALYQPQNQSKSQPPQPKPYRNTPTYFLKPGQANPA
jgi:hypothetical protein